MKAVTQLLRAAALTALVFGAAGAMAQEAEAPPPAAPKANSLDDLLRQVEQRRINESREHTQREQRFRREKDQQQRMLNDARAERRREEQSFGAAGDDVRGKRDPHRRSCRNSSTSDSAPCVNCSVYFSRWRAIHAACSRVPSSLPSIPNRGEWLGDLAKKMGTASRAGHHR